MDCFRRMQFQGILPDDFTLSSVLGPCSQIKNAASEIRGIHEIFLQRGGCDAVVAAALIHAYGRCGRIDEARSLLCQEQESDSDVWNSLMAVCSWNGEGRRGLEIFWRMHQMGVRPDGFSFSTAIGACTAIGDFAQGWSILGQIRCLELDRENEILAVALIEMLAKSGKIQEACSVFQHVRIPRTLILWNATIAALAQGRRIGAALRLFEMMRREGGLAPDAVSWTTLITALEDREEEAFQLLRRMDLEGVKPDRVTFVAVVNACSNSLSSVRAIHSRIVGSGFSSFLEIKNALLAKYSQCGGLQEARSIFSSSGQHRDVISWSSMIESCAHHGRGEESLALFRRMQQEGVDPNAITFLSILSACRHSGFLDEEALRCVGAMEADYGIQPGQEHRACVVDLLGIAGRLKEAENLITADDRSHGEVAWTSFLGGCRVHPDEAGAIERAQEQVQHCESSGFHILLSNVKSG
ncbi:pentatricopeptide repeat-containing protein At4g14820 [Selaginella moellendorffii]|uniref:pentatricopeptide repeat-containing protein At4g14820 n=1 Tax=Selaginella moellendorffii TaxID=88036 RepID=UPI000D1CDE19|nr:pentatricopeptide repeat-containing protein At4g14820 [Selaginella moellendorffii]|eukprot:XP_024526518.1 pentatricopeptide repeat-containing protein At4g14820 [Selaginella moellendorffii]